MSSILRVLHLEDDSNDAELVRAVLEEGGIECDIVWVKTKEDFLKAMEEDGFGLILADYKLPSFDGVSALALAHEKFPDVPFIFVSGAIGEEHAIETLKNGATDYVLKQRLSRLATSVSRALREVEERKERQRLQEQLFHNALYDALTGLPNRALLLDRLSQVLERKKRNDAHSFAVLVLDLDRFKTINDSLGHMIGDQLLIAVSGRLSHCLHSADTLVRLGGDEFVIFLEDVQDVDTVLALVTRIQSELSSPFDLNGHEVFTTVSVGVVMGELAFEGAQDVLRAADTAMNVAKAQGKARCEVFNPGMYDHAVESLHLEVDFRHAISRGELFLHYQPVVSFKSFEIVGVEALVRWRHPQRGIIPPLEFIPIAEETGLILPMGEWVLQTACKQKKIWRECGFGDLTVAVNVSSRQLRQKDWIGGIERILKEEDMRPQELELELTESVLMENITHAVGMMMALKRIGVGFSIDDFGTGYSSLSYLKRFPIRTLKIDRSFVQDITRDPDDAAIVSAVIALAHSMKLKVIAEGVETKEQADFLLTYRCDEMQGYLFSKPVSPEEITEMLRKRIKLQGVG